MDHDCAATCIDGRFRLPFGICTRPSARTVCSHLPMHHRWSNALADRAEMAAQMDQLLQAYRITVVSTHIRAPPTSMLYLLNGDAF